MDGGHRVSRSIGFQLLPALTTEKPTRSNSSMMKTEKNRGAKVRFRNKGNKAFQLCAKSVLTVIRTFVSDKTYITGRRWLPM